MMLNLKGIPATLRIFACVVILLMTSCGGGGSQTAGGGTGGTGISYGPVTGFGSIFVNGVEFNTDNATYVQNDVTFIRTPGQLDSNFLRVGMTVEVQGSYTSATTGVANTVIVRDITRGPLESFSGSANAGTLVVLGQTVHIDSTTQLDATITSLATLQPGVTLEIHGNRSADGSIFASFIEVETHPVAFNVRGSVSNHNAIAHTFVIGALNGLGGLTVDYTSTPSVFAGMIAPVGNNWNGLFVGVRGTVCSGFNPCGTLTATQVTPISLGLVNASQAEIEGLVTAQTSISDFTVGSQRVLTNVATVYSGGLASDIVPGTKIEVEGSLSAGVIQARKISFLDAVLIDANATVSGSIVSLIGLPGLTVSVNTFTDLSNANSATPVNLTPLNGRNLRIRGRATGTNSVLATRILDNGLASVNGNMSLLGSVALVDVNASLFRLTLLGVPVDMSLLNPNTDFKDVTGAAISRASFFDALTTDGGLVMATSRLPLSGSNAFDALQLKAVQLGDD